MCNILTSALIISLGAVEEEILDTHSHKTAVRASASSETFFHLDGIVG